MAQHDYVIDNSTGANVRADINNVLQAIATNNSGSSAPSATFASQFFADTSAGIMKLRNTSDNGFVNLFTLAGGIDVDAASNFNEDVTFTGASANIVFDKSDNALEFADGASAKFGADGDLEIKHNNNNSFINDTGTGQLMIQASALRLRNYPEGHTQVRCSDDVVELYFDNSKKFETTSFGATVTGNLSFGDNGIASFGASGDLQIYHNGSNSLINDLGTGGVIIAASKTNIMNAAASENMAVFNDNGAVELYYDGSKKLETKSTGLDVTGQIDVIGGFVSVDDNFSFVCGSGGDAQLFHNGNDLFLLNTTGSIFFDPKSSERGVIIKPDNSVELYFDGSKKFFTNSSGITVESTSNTPKVEFRGASNLDLGRIDVDQFVSNFSMMRFSTLSSGTITERMRILDNGSVLIGTVSQGGEGGVTIMTNASQGAALIMFDRANTTNSSEVLRFENNNSTVGSITHDHTQTFYNTTSDYRLKENATVISDGITRLKTLKPYRFNFKIDADKTLDGFFAHEVTAVPEAVTGTKDEVDSHNNPVYQGIDQSKLVPLLVAAVQELIGKVEALEAA